MVSLIRIAGVCLILGAPLIAITDAQSSTVAPRRSGPGRTQQQIPPELLKMARELAAELKKLAEAARSGMLTNISQVGPILDTYLTQYGKIAALSIKSVANDFVKIVEKMDAPGLKKAADDIKATLVDLSGAVEKYATAIGPQLKAFIDEAVKYLESQKKKSESSA